MAEIWIALVALFGAVAAYCGFRLLLPPGLSQCWECGKELDDSDEVHLDLSPMSGKVYCRRCWERARRQP